MQKLRKGRKFHRKADQRKALLHSLASALFLKEKIKTTEAKAKELSIYAEKQISRAKIGDPASRKLLMKNFTPQVVKKMINELGSRYKDRKGGYTRVIKLGFRKLDGAKIAIIELVK